MVTCIFMLSCEKITNCIINHVELHCWVHNLIKKIKLLVSTYCQKDQNVVRMTQKFTHICSSDFLVCIFCTQKFKHILAALHKEWRNIGRIQTWNQQRTQLHSFLGFLHLRISSSGVGSSRVGWVIKRVVGVVTPIEWLIISQTYSHLCWCNINLGKTLNDVLNKNTIVFCLYHG